jgi:DNA-binding LytR/AlgR family response regulator
MPLALTHREQMVALFAGEVEEGDFLTQPFYSVPLCVEIANCVNPTSEDALRKAIFGDERPADSIPQQALGAIEIAYRRWTITAGANARSRSRGL